MPNATEPRQHDGRIRAPDIRLATFGISPRSGCSLLFRLCTKDYARFTDPVNQKLDLREFDTSQNDPLANTPTDKAHASIEAPVQGLEASMAVSPTMGARGD